MQQNDVSIVSKDAI
uniref:Uncharacterized protein n=1 Tax=Romanomermis culicivorax TaxID=13658 RepID=A0A915J1C7_ROMCU